MAWPVAWALTTYISKGKEDHLSFECNFNPLTTDHTSVESDLESDYTILSVYVLIWIQDPGKFCFQALLNDAYWVFSQVGTISKKGVGAPL